MWQNEVEQCSNDAEDVLKHEGQHNAECSCSGSFLNLVLRRKQGRKAKKTVEASTSETQKADTFESISHTPILNSSFENGGFGDLGGTRKLALEKIMKALKDHNTRRIGVYGTAGVGKTTLVKEAAQKSLQEGLFTEVVMVTVTKSFDLRKVQQEIAYKLNVEVEDNMSASANKLQDKLKDERKLLIILDDLWKKLELEDAGIYFDMDNQNGCKILLVSRNRYLLHDDMGVEKDIKVELLSEKEAMGLFDEVVGVKSKEPIFRDLATAIVEKCGYLPVAIKPIAYALKDRDISDWRIALDKMKSPLKDTGAYLSTKTSYEFLSPEGKMILVLCAQHREVENISVEDLVNIFVAICDMFSEVDTLQDARKMDTLQDARKEVDTVVDNVKGSGLLLDGGEDGSVKLHDVTRENMVSIAMEDESMICFGNFRSLTRTLINHDPTGISLLGDDFNQFPDGLPCSELRLLLMHSGIDRSSKFRPILFPRVFLEKAKELRAFCLRSITVQPLPLSPNSLQNLQTLSLKNCVLKDIAFVGELKSLVVLDLSYSKFEQLPEQIGKLTCLRQLNLNNCSDLKVIQPNVISKLERLEELYMDNVNVEWAVEGSRNILVEVKNLPRLSALHLYLLDACAIPDDMFVDVKLKRFNIIVGRKELYPRKTSSRLFYLKLDESSHLYKHCFQMLIKESEVLYLDTLPGVTSGVPLFEEKVAFPNQLPASSSMPNLKKLNVQFCKELKHVFASAIVGSLTQLEELVISGCPAMEEIIAVEEGTSSQKILFPNLTFLKLENLRKLRTFCGGGCKVVLKNLQELEIAKCNILRSLEDFVTSESLPQLTKLSIRFCELMEEVFVMKEEGDEERKIKRISFPKLEHLTLEFLPNLKRFSFCEAEFPSLLGICTYHCPKLRTFIAKSTPPTSSIEQRVEEIAFDREEALSNIMLSRITFGNLQDLTIYHCINLQYLLPFEMVESLKDLKKLMVAHCDDMKQIITKAVGEEGGRFKNIISFPKLESIELFGLQKLKLKSFCEGDRIECPSLLKLKIHICPEFRTFIPNSASLEESELVAQQPLFNKKVELDNLEVLSVCWVEDINELWPRQFSTVLFPKLKFLEFNCPTGFCLSKILRFKNLETIDLGGCLEENIWQHEEHGQMLTHLRRLKLQELNELKHLFEDPAENLQLVNQTLPNLEILIVTSCSRLETLVLSYSHFSFENLAVLELLRCDGLQNLFDSWTAKTLGQLKTMSIGYCKQLREVFRDVKTRLPESEIVFNRLGTLTLYNLPRLKSFYDGKTKLEFPKLEVLTVQRCPEMRTFSHGMAINFPNLKINNDKHTEKYLESDLNARIRNLWESQDATSNPHAKPFKHAGLKDVNNYTAIFDRVHATDEMAYTGGVPWFQQPPYVVDDEPETSYHPVVNDDNEDSEDDAFATQIRGGLDEAVARRATNVASSLRQIAKNPMRRRRAATKTLIAKTMLSIARSISSVSTWSSDTNNNLHQVLLVQDVLNELGLNTKYFLDCVKWFHQNQDWCSSWLRMTAEQKRRFLDREIGPQPPL